jgi:hypothetical protein
MIMFIGAPRSVDQLVIRLKITLASLVVITPALVQTIVDSRPL